MADYSLPRGDSLPLYITVTDQARKPIDISLAKLWMTAKRQYGDLDAAAVFQISTTSGDIVITDGPNGLATIVVPASATASLPAQEIRLAYDIQIRMQNGIVQTIERGTLSITPDVTQTTL